MVLRRSMRRNTRQALSEWNEAIETRKNIIVGFLEAVLFKIPLRYDVMKRF